MFLTRRLLFAKRSTGLVGLSVVPDARSQCIVWYKKTLEKLKVLNPKSEYRISVHDITAYRLGVMERHRDNEYEAIEKEIDCGQIEELLDEAKDEFQLIDMIKGTPMDEPATLDWRAMVQDLTEEIENSKKENVENQDIKPSS